MADRARDDPGGDDPESSDPQRSQAKDGPWIVLAADVPLAPATHGSRVRNVQLVEALRAAGFRVLYVYWERTPREGDVTAMRALVDELDVVRAKRSTFGKRSLRLRRGIAGTLGRAQVLPERAWWWLVEDRDADALCPRVLRARVEEILSRQSVAAVIASYANLAPLAGLARERGVLGIVDTLDVMHLRAATLREQRIQPTGLLVPREVEARWLSQADFVVAIQEREAATLAGMVGRERVLVIEHAVRVPRSFDPAPAREPALVLLGSNNRPNQHGLFWFLEHVWPLVLRDVPDAELLVFGPLSRTPACAGPRVRAEGEVDEPAAAYARARAVINPVRAGAGLKIKTVEALSFSRALVTTTPGAEGLEAAAGEAFLMADEPAAFARACASLLVDPAAALALGTRAGAFARARFAPEEVYKRLIALIREHARS
jgi:glycosyltransferase involved in cell wall biosynthesis